MRLEGRPERMKQEECSLVVTEDVQYHCSQVPLTLEHKIQSAGAAVARLGSTHSQSFSIQRDLR